jgi:fibronectin type III domain protein
LSGGYAFSAQQLGASLTWNGATFTFGPAGQKNVVAAAGQAITLPTGSYSQLDLLAVGVNGNQPVERFVIHYTDGTSQIFDQSISDWFTPQSYTGESTALATTYRNTASGGRDSRTFNAYGYSFDVDPSKTIASITLPVNSNVEILAISAIAPSAAAPDLTAVAVSASQVNLSWSIPTGSGITGYNIYRSTVSGGESTPLTSTPLGPGVTSYSDRDVLPGNTYYYTVKAIAGTTLGSSSNEVLTTIPNSGLSTEIDLAGFYNLLGMTVDDTQFNTGLNFSGTALSATALGTSKTVGGINFMFSTSTSQNVIRATGQTITLPAQSFGQFDLLATTVNGNQLNVPFTVTYTDGTSQTFYQSMSDWFTPQNYAGETLAYATSYRNNSNGTQDARTFDVYEYSFTLNSAKQVQSITLPRDGQVSVLSMTGVLPVAPPTSLVVNAASSTEADLIWAAAAGTITGYNIYRGTTAGGESTTPLNSTPLSASTLSFHDTTALPGNTYYYTVKALDSPILGTASNEVSLTMALSGTSAQVDLSSEYNTTGITVDGSVFSNGIDNSGFALSASLLGTSQSFGGTTFSIASAGGNNVVSANGQTIGLPNGSYSSVEMLATAVNGNQPGQTFIVHYTDGSSQTIIQGISDWFSPQSYAGESVALSMGHRNTATGGQDARTFNVYAYSLAVDNSKTISSITLPDNTHVNVLSITTVA